MSENCNHQCDNCEQTCDKKDFLVPANANSKIKKVIGIVSGKGGVGKSSVTSLLSVLKARQGYKVALLDGDITGPSLPYMFGLENATLYSRDGKEIIPATTSLNMKLMSTNFLLKSSEDPVIWRGPVLAGMIKQFWQDVYWGDIDYMFVDMPPGTGDVPLTIFQSLPIDGIVIVTSPQELVGMIVQKAVNMAKQMNIPILGLVENMSYLECLDCHKRNEVFGESHVDEVAQKIGVPVLAKCPIDKNLAKACDEGMIESYYAPWLDEFDVMIKDI